MEKLCKAAQAEKRVTKELHRPINGTQSNLFFNPEPRKRNGLPSYISDEQRQHDHRPSGTSTYCKLRTAKLSSQAPNAVSQIFAGLRFYFNGRSGDKQTMHLKGAVSKYGGKTTPFMSVKGVTHVIAENLSAVKTDKAMKSLKTKVVHPDWLMRCIAEERLLPDAPFRVVRSQKLGVTHFFSARGATISNPSVISDKAGTDDGTRACDASPSGLMFTITSSATVESKGAERVERPQDAAGRRKAGSGASISLKEKSNSGNFQDRRNRKGSDAISRDSDSGREITKGRCQVRRSVKGSAEARVGSAEAVSKVRHLTHHNTGMKRKWGTESSSRCPSVDESPAVANRAVDARGGDPMPTQSHSAACPTR